MPGTRLPYEPALARRVRAKTLEPRQRQTPPRLQTAADFRRQYMRKHPYRSDFHSRAEHLHAGLLEGDPTVRSYVPQPFRLTIDGKWYTPDCYVLSRTGTRRVIELKPGGEMRPEQRDPLTAFFIREEMRFEVISNESILERELEAENWLEIVRILHQAPDVDYPEAQDRVLERVYREGPCTLGELIDPGDREHTYRDEIALFRLVHRGHLMAKLDHAPLDFNTLIEPPA